MRNHGQGSFGVLALFGAALAFFLYSPASDANPTVGWTPSSLYASLAAGESTTTTATFIPSANATNVTVRVVPSLAPYVSMSPASFPSVQKGTSYTVAVTMTAPVDLVVGAYDGTIHLRQENRTLAQPLPVVMEVVWPTFDGGEDLGFSIQYPPGWYVDTRYANSIAFSNSDDLSLPREERAFFRVLRLENANPPQLPIDEWFDAYFSLGFSSEITSRELLTVGSRDAVRITYLGIGTHVGVYVPDGADVLNISYDLDDFLADYDDILQSLSIREIISSSYPEDL